jgi:RNA polymerase sigma-70 factor, ECF subfamily
MSVSGTLQDLQSAFAKQRVIDVPFDAVAALWSEGRSTWRTLPLSPDAFVAHLVRTRADEPGASIEGLHAGDLYLAWAALERCAAAVKTIERMHLARIPTWAARFDRSPSFADDLGQEVARQLFVGTSHTGPKLLGYRGHGHLAAFVRVIALRIANRQKQRAAGRKKDRELPESLAAKDLDPEVALLKKRFAREFQAALAATLEGLSSDERNLLKLHYLDGLTLEGVADVYRVSRATAARSLARARGRIIEETQRRLADRLGASSPGTKTLISLLESDLNLSIGRLIRSTGY